MLVITYAIYLFDESCCRDRLEVEVFLLILCQLQPRAENFWKLEYTRTLPFLGGTRRGQNNWTLNPKPLEIEAKRPYSCRDEGIRIALFELFGIFFLALLMATSLKPNPRKGPESG